MGFLRAPLPTSGLTNQRKRFERALILCDDIDFFSVEKNPCLSAL